MLQGLGVTSLKHHILLFSRRSLEKKKNTFQIAASKNGSDFTNFKKWAEILKDQGQQEKIKDCSDFRISKTVNSRFLTYKLHQGKSYQLCGALWSGFSHWQKTGELADIKETGMVVPRYCHQGQYILYFGEKVIRMAQSADLINWQVLPKPIFTLNKKLLKNGFLLKIGTLIPTKKGILLIYYLYQNTKLPHSCSIMSIVLDKNDPSKILEEVQEPIGQQKKAVYPLGIVRFKQQLVAYWQTDKGKIFASYYPFLRLITPLKKSYLFSFLHKFIKNPILKPLQKHRWESKAVFNTAAVYDKKKVHFIYRAVGDDDISVWGYASSKDGFNIDERSKKPVYSPAESFKKKSSESLQLGLPFYLSGGGGLGGCEDPRITKLENRLYITYTAFDGFNPPRVALTSIKVDDFLNKRWNWEKPVLLSPPGEIHKNWVIFPEKVNGKYALLHSLSPQILIDYFEDLNFDGKTFIRSYYDGNANKGIWEERIRGIGPPPIKTHDGWLVFYHAMGKQEPGSYKMGAMILDYQQPTKILYRCRQPVLEPTEIYENEGLKPRIVYSCGATIVDKQLLVYYGGADTVICLASSPLNEFLNKLKSTGTPRFMFKTTKVD